VTAVHPRIVAALRAQLRARDPDARRVGWKIALGIAEVEELIGDEPVIRNLTSATQLAPGATYDGGGPLHADAEVVVEVGPGGDVAGLGVGLELVDLRRPAGGMEAMIAGNVTHRAFVLGPSLRDAKPGHGALIVDGEVRARAPAVVDPAATVRGERVAAEIDGLGRVDAVIAD
jgi:hypothetical protein